MVYRKYKGPCCVLIRDQFYKLRHAPQVEKEKRFISSDCPYSLHFNNFVKNSDTFMIC